MEKLAADITNMITEWLKLNPILFTGSVFTLVMGFLKLVKSMADKGALTPKDDSKP